MFQVYKALFKTLLRVGHSLGAGIRPAAAGAIATSIATKTEIRK
jgi:hypothetical protein